MQNLLHHSKTILIAAILNVSVITQCFSQTVPSPQTLPYMQDFSFLAHTSATYPDGWQGWNLSNAGSGTSFRITAPIADMPLTASSDASIGSAGIHNYGGKIGFLARNNGNAADPSVALAISTSGQTNIKVVFDVMTIRNPYGGSTHINNVELQYRIGNTLGTFTSVSGNIYSNNTVNQLTGTTPQNMQNILITLPASCDNQPLIQLRWVQRDQSGSGQQRPSFALDNISICGLPQVSASGSTAICTGDSVILSASAGASYLWSTGATTQSISVSAAGNYYCSVTQQGGCSNMSPSTTISLLPLPNVSISASQSAVLCPGCQINLEATGAATYAWDLNLGGATTSSVSVAPMNTSSYSVTGIDENGCKSSAMQQISVGSLSSAVLPGYSNMTVSNLNSLIQISSAPGATSVKYTFTPNDGGSAVMKTVSPFSSSLNLGTVSGLQYNKTYSVTVQPFQGSIGGCISTASQVNVAAPVAWVYNGCGKSYNNLNAMILSSVCPGATSIEWVFTPANGGTPITKTISPFSYSLNLSTVTGLQYGTSYSVKVRASAGSLVGPYSSPCQINIVAPAIQVYYGCGKSFSNLNATIQSTICPGATSIDWMFTPIGGGIPIIKTVSPFSSYLNLSSVVGLQYGISYSVQVRASAGISVGNYSNSSCIISIGSSGAKFAGADTEYSESPDKNVTAFSNEEINNDVIALYPNPSNGSFSVELKEFAQVSVFNVVGENVYQAEHNSGIAQLDLTQFGNGIYFVRVTFMKGINKTERVVIQD